MKPTKVIPPTTARVPIDEHLNQITAQKVGQTVQSTPQGIDQHLDSLDYEWDIDRWYELSIGVISLVGLVLGLTVNLWWLALPAFGAVSLLTHGLFGWSVLLFVFRAFGVRTATEIAHERYALKALRGDFKQLGAVVTPDEREAISNFESEGGMVYGPAMPDSADPEVVQSALEAAQK